MDAHESMNHFDEARAQLYWAGLFAAALTCLLALASFGFALLAVPISGANCPGACIAYPYLDTLAQFPRDYIWMALAICLLLSYVVLMVVLESYASASRRLFARVGVSFALIAAVLLLGDYYVQIAVVPVSLLNQETAGLPLLTQYNPHGVFIALEELGYAVMSFSFLWMALAFAGHSRLERAIRWTFAAGCWLALAALVLTMLAYGLERKDRFEVAILSADWLVLIVNGALLSVLFQRELKAVRGQRPVPDSLGMRA